jgi:hypothetical protein
MRLRKRKQGEITYLCENRIDFYEGSCAVTASKNSFGEAALLDEAAFSHVL